MDNGEIKEKYFAKILLSGRLDLKFLVSKVEHSSSMTAADFGTATKHLDTPLKRHLCNGEVAANKQLLNAMKNTQLFQYRSFDVHDQRVEYSHTKQLHIVT